MRDEIFQRERLTPPYTALQTPGTNQAPGNGTQHTSLELKKQGLNKARGFTREQNEL